MTKARSHLLAKLLLLLGAALVAAVTLLAATAYATFAVIWLHAPAVSAIGLSALLAAPFLLLSWALFRVARRLQPAPTMPGIYRP